MNELDDIELPAELEALLASGRSEQATAAELSSLRAGLGAKLDAPISVAPKPWKAFAGAGVVGLLLAAGAFMATGSGDSPMTARQASSVAPARRDVDLGASAGESAEDLAEEEQAEEDLSEEDLSEEDLSEEDLSEEDLVERDDRDVTEDFDSPALEPPPQTGGDSPAAQPEDVLIDRAQRALDAQPRRTLALTRQHQRLYPSGLLVQEREVLALEALRALGRDARLRQRAVRFLARWPQSPHTRRVRHLMEESSVQR